MHGETLKLHSQLSFIFSFSENKYCSCFSTFSLPL